MDADMEKLLEEIRRDNPIPPHLLRRRKGPVKTAARAPKDTRSPRERLYAMTHKEGNLPDQTKSYYQGLGRCWDWLGNKDLGGYAVFSMSPHIRAHRASWEIHFGPIPKGMWVLHKCDNRSCSNPEHLFLGDSLTNNQDRERKGRGGRYRPPSDFFKTNPHFIVKGERKGAAKLKEWQVREIREKRAQGADCPSLAKTYGVSPSTIRGVVGRTAWKHVA